MKKWKKWLVRICVGFIAVVIFILIWQWENIQVLTEVLKYDQDQIKMKINKTKEDTKAALDEYNLGEVRDLTLEEEQELMRGELTVEDAVQRIMNSEPTSKEINKKHIDINIKDNESDIEDKNSLSLKEKEKEIKKQNKAYSKTKPSDTLNKDKIVEKYVTKMYILQATYISALGSLESRARKAYGELPKEERNLIGAQKLAPIFIDEGLTLEKQCDSEVQAILMEMEFELNNSGEDTSIISTMKEAYETQKRLKKSYYLSSIK